MNRSESQITKGFYNYLREVPIIKSAGEVVRGKVREGTASHSPLAVGVTVLLLSCRFTYNYKLGCSW